MKEQDFNNLVRKQNLYRASLMSRPEKKRVAGTTDRLIQFKRMAAIRKCTVESAAIDLATKQFTDFIDMADGSHTKHDSIEFMREIGADIQNYIDLTLAIKEEQLNKRKK